jgi:predicted CoA-substrate-specific enzyme activase
MTGGEPGMITAGIDVGNKTTKAVLVAGGKILSWSLTNTRGDINGLSEGLLKEAAEKARIAVGDIMKIAATGAGGKEVACAKDSYTSMLCSAVGAGELFPSVEVGIDIGAEECRVFRGSGAGDIIDFFINDKCAAGVGMFIEIMAKALDVPLEEVGALSLKSTKELPLSTSCVVFAESEVVSLVNQGESREDVFRAIHIVAAMKASGLLRKIGVAKKFVTMGGVALNSGFIECLRSVINLDMFIPEHPQILGAYGAALLAQRRK